jgi:hypothetical protein
MIDFIELQGASGARYRFRAADLASLPAAAGNFVLVRREPDGAVVVGSGSANNLSEATSRCSAAFQEHRADAVFFYLDITRRGRTQVHEDITALHRPAIIAAELDG